MLHILFTCLTRLFALVPNARLSTGFIPFNNGEVGFELGFVISDGRSTSSNLEHLGFIVPMQLVLFLLLTTLLFLSTFSCLRAVWLGAVVFVVLTIGHILQVTTVVLVRIFWKGWRTFLYTVLLLLLLMNYICLVSWCLFWSWIHCSLTRVFLSTWTYCTASLLHYYSKKFWKMK